MISVVARLAVAAARKARPNDIPHHIAQYVPMRRGFCCMSVPIGAGAGARAGGARRTCARRICRRSCRGSISGRIGSGVGAVAAGEHEHRAQEQEHQKSAHSPAVVAGVAFPPDAVTDGIRVVIHDQLRCSGRYQPSASLSRSVFGPRKEQSSRWNNCPQPAAGIGLTRLGRISRAER
jgi:hypothetical protein